MNKRVKSLFVISYLGHTDLMDLTPQTQPQVPAAARGGVGWQRKVARLNSRCGHVSWSSHYFFFVHLESARFHEEVLDGVENR